MDQHSNPIPIKKAIPFIRKSHHYQKPSTPTHNSKPSLQIQTRFNSVSPLDPPNSPKFPQTTKNYYNPHEDAMDVRNQKRTNTFTDTSTHFPYSPHSPHNMFESELGKRSWLLPQVNKQLNFLKNCYEKAATQNQSLIQHISAKQIQLNKLNHQVVVRKLQNNQVEKQFVEEGLQTIKSQENQSELSNEEEKREINNQLKLIRFDGEEKRTSSQKENKLRQLKEELKEVNLFNFLATQQISYQQI